MKGRRLRLSCLLLSLCWLTRVSAQVVVSVRDDVTNEPLIGVEVFDQASGYNDITDQLGKISIPALPDQAVVSFSYMGYQKIEKAYNNLVAEPIIRMKGGMQLDLIEVVGRSNTKSNDILNQVERIKSEIITRSQSQNTAEALEKNAGVYIQRSQLGGGSPVVRGFEANKVLLAVDGVRMNNAIYRSGHLQNAITVDANSLSNLEVIYGPGSLIYGSDALGGVIHFKTKSPSLRLTEDARPLVGSAFARYNSLGNLGLHLDAEWRGKKWASFSSVSYTSFADLRMGSNRTSKFPDYGKRLIYTESNFSDPTQQDRIVQNEDFNVQVGTGYRQYDLLQKIKYKASDALSFELNLQHSTSSDVPRYDALIEATDDGLRWAEWYYGPQTRTMGALRTNYRIDQGFADEIIMINSWQRIDEDRISRRFGMDLREYQEEDLLVQSNTIDLVKDLKNYDLTLKYGLEYTTNQLMSDAFELSPSGQRFDNTILTRYPSGSSSTAAFGVYTYFSKRILEGANVIGGMRYNSSRQFMTYDRSDPFEWPEDFYEGIENRTNALTWALGLNYTKKDWKLQVMSGSSFRSPNIDDSAKIRINGGEVQVPNLSLSPERAINYEVNVNRVFDKRHQVGLSAFYTSVNDIVVRQPLPLPNGDDQIINQGDTLTTVGNVNADQGNVSGLSANIDSRLGKKLRLDGSITYIRGTATDSEGIESPLAHIPPVYGRVGMTFTEDRVKASLVYRFNGAKPLDQYGGSTDNPEFATADGSLAWSTFNFYFQYKLSSNLELSSSLENIFDVHYRTFASGVSAPGRNLSVTLKGSF